MSYRREIITLKNGLKIWRWLHEDKWGVVISEEGEGYIYRNDGFSNIVENGAFVLATCEIYKPGRDTRYMGNDEDYEVYDYTELYLLDGNGNKLLLDEKEYSNRKIRCGNNSAHSIFFACSYEFIRYSDNPVRYHQAVDTYNIYPQEGKDYVDVEVISLVDGKRSKIEAYRLWIGGQKEKLESLAKKHCQTFE